MIEFSDTDLILNPDGSVYHLGLKEEDIADIVLLVGDPERVDQVSRHFDRVELRKHKREFITHTGYLNNLRISCLSTGIGPDNIDIALNELDAAVNIDLTTRRPKEKKKSLKLIRIGTSGALSADIPVDSILLSKNAIGLSALMAFYDYQPELEELYLQQAFQQFIKAMVPNVPVYAANANAALLDRFDDRFVTGCTYTACGFYGPQGRKLNFMAKAPNLLDRLTEFQFLDNRITNIEMETATIYAMGKTMGHQCLSVNVILANRIRKEFSKDPHAAVDLAIREVLDIITHY